MNIKNKTLFIKVENKIADKTLSVFTTCERNYIEKGRKSKRIHAIKGKKTKLDYDKMVISKGFGLMEMKCYHKIILK